MRLLNAIRPRGGEPLSAITGGLRDTRSRASASAGRVAVLARAAFGRSRGPRLDGDPAERFRSAAELHGTDLASVQDATHKAALLYMWIAMALVGLSVVTWASRTAMWLGHVGPIILAVTLSLRSAYGNWTVRFGRLDGLGVFLRSPGAWVPESAAVPRPRRGGAAALLVVGVLGTVLLGAHPASAAEADASTLDMFSSLPASDIWGHLLSFVFPAVGPVGGEVTPISSGIADAFSGLLSVLLGAGAAILSVQIIAATADAAHTGELLGGGKWHQIWSPLRVVYGFAALAPVIKGFCLLQLVVLWVAVGSGHLGNRMWAGFVSGLTGPTISAPNLPETVPMVRDLLRTEVCFASAEQVAASYQTPAPTWPATYVAGATVGTIASGSWSWVAGWWSSSPRDANPITLQRLTWDYGPCGIISATASPDASGGLGTLNTAQLAAFDKLRGSVREAAKAIVATTQAGEKGADAGTISDTFGDIVKAKNAYDEALRNATIAFVSEQGKSTFSDFQAAATNAGWISAGPYFMTVARLNASALDATQGLPSVDSTSFSANRIRGPLHDALYGGDNPVLGVVDAWWDRSIAAPEAGGLSAAAASAGTLRTGGAVGTIRSALSSDSWLQRHLLAAASLDPSRYDGIQQLVDFGDYTIGIGEAIVGVDFLKKVAPYFAGPEAAVAAKAVEGGGGGLTWDQIEMGTIGLMILAAGIYAAMILPMMPCIHFVFAVIGILITVVEGVCAAPLWALAHVRMDGDSAVTTAQRAGYSVLMQVFLRIPLTLLGLFFSLLMFDAAVWLLSIALAPAMAAATTESTFGVVSTLVYMVLTAVLSYSLANRSFGLITALPDGVLRWLGADGGGASGAEGGHAGQALAVVQRVTGSPPRLPGVGKAGKPGGSPAAGGDDPAPSGKGAATGTVRPAAGSTAEEGGA